LGGKTYWQGEKPRKKGGSRTRRNSRKTQKGKRAGSACLQLRKKLISGGERVFRTKKPPLQIIGKQGNSTSSREKIIKEMEPVTGVADKTESTSRSKEG